MDQSFFKLAAAAGYGENRLAVLANNLANVNTPGFKADQLHFSQVLDGVTGKPRMSAEQFVEFTPGAVEQTGNPLDLTIHGDGFFELNTPEGTRYTRDGSFRLGADGILASADGHPVMGSAGPIAIPPDTATINVSASGEVSADGLSLGNLQIMSFAGGAAPQKMGGNLFSGIGAVAVARPSVAQGALERSNVETVMEMTRMIEISRGYEAYQKLIQTMDQAASQANSLSGV